MNAETTAWIVGLTGVVGILSGLVGQALYWGVFKGSIEARTLATENNVADLRVSRSQMWTEINAHGKHLTAIETRLNQAQTVK